MRKNYWQRICLLKYTALYSEIISQKEVSARDKKGKDKHTKRS
jgi:hypothetical protein